jgi:hypothetical protein
MAGVGGIGLTAALGSTIARESQPATTPLRAQDASSSSWNPAKLGAPLMRDPVWVYDNWSAYAEGMKGLKDTRLTEELAMRQLDQVVRVMRQGVHFDYYMMNAFWFAPDGAYREWRKPDWPSGPDRWIESCYSMGIKPGLWFGTNSLWKINAAPQWRDSLGSKPEKGLQLMSLYEGGFLADFMSTLQYWYERGIRLFEFDVANFDAATERAKKTQSPEEIRESNEAALSEALKAFRRRNPDVMLVAFNDFGGDIYSTASPFPFRKPVELRWLEVFDTLYSGDVRVSDVPQMNFWRSVDLFNDHMVRRYEQSMVPLERIDPFFTLSTTWFGYNREKRAWKSMLLLAVARGSWKQTIYGDLRVLSDEEARWFAKVQRIYSPLLALGRSKTFGGIPGEIQPYGFGAADASGVLYTVVNPAQRVLEIDLPQLSRMHHVALPGRILFRDAGHPPLLKGAKLILGPEQMSVVGFGRFASEEYDLGVEEDAIVPHWIREVRVPFHGTGQNAIAAEVSAPVSGDLRVLVWQRAQGDVAPRSPFLRIEAEQNGKKLSVAQPNQDRAISTGISWAAGEIRRDQLMRELPVRIRCTSPEKDPVTLSAAVYEVGYGSGVSRSSGE